MARQGPIRKLRGFTMIELMVTIVVFAILTAIALPSFKDYFERYRLRSAADDVVNLLALARQGAVKEDRNVNVTLGGDTVAWCVGAIQQAAPAEYAQVSTTPAACLCATAPASCMVAGDNLVVDGTGLRGVTVAAVGKSLSYDSKGGTLVDITAATPTIDFISSTQRYGLQVQVNTLGQARACIPAGKRSMIGYQSC